MQKGGLQGGADEGGGARTQGGMTWTGTPAT